MKTALIALALATITQQANAACVFRPGAPNETYRNMCKALAKNIDTCEVLTQRNCAWVKCQVKPGQRINGGAQRCEELYVMGGFRFKETLECKCE